MSFAPIDKSKVPIKNIQGLQDSLNSKPDTSEVNLIINNINPHDSVWFKDETYHKDTIDSKLSKKANLYQPALVSPTVTTQAVGDNSTKAASTAFVYEKNDWYLQTCLDIGISAIAMPLGSALFGSNTGSALIDGAMFKQYYKITKTSTLTGFKFVQQTQGVYVADNYNGIKIYSVSGGNLTEISGGETANDGNLWKGANASTVTKDLPTPIVLTPGIYCIAFLWNTSDGSPTAPKLHIFNNVNSLGGTLRFSSYEASKTAMPQSTTAAVGSTFFSIMGLWPY